MADIRVVISVTVQDADGEIFAVPLYANIAEATSLTAIQTAMDSILNIIDDVIDGAITRAGVRIDLTLPVGLKASAVAGSETERTALYSFSAAGTNYDASFDFPAMALATLVSGSNTVDPDNTEVSALVSEFIGPSTAIHWTDKYGNDLVALLRARKTFRKHAKSTKQN